MSEFKVSYLSMQRKSQFEEKKALIIIMHEIRDLDVCFKSIKKNVVMPLNADLAYCGRQIPAKSIQTYNFKFAWCSPEPENWVSALDELHVNSQVNWRALIPHGDLGKSHFLGPTINDAASGSGAINLYWKSKLREFITDEILAMYSWIILTRSDFKWIVSHPKIESLETDRIYVQFGESYEGINDRHAIIPSSMFLQFLKIPDLIFRQTDETKESFIKNEVSGLNPERFLDYALDKLKLKQFLIEIPYLGYLIRKPTSPTRWGKGQYYRSLGVFVKYPRELELARASKYLHIRTYWDWGLIIRELVNLNDNLANKKEKTNPYEVVLNLLESGRLQERMMLCTLINPKAWLMGRKLSIAGIRDR